MKDPVVAVALSGGIDSLVSGFLLKQRYKDIFGLHFTTGYEKRHIDPGMLENQLGFPVFEIDLSDIFEQNVVQYFIKTYLDGKTPNPCIICNKKIKFGTLLENAFQKGADFLATGHYATVVNSISFPDRRISTPYLEKGSDPLKDQSYFLSLLSADQLEHILFPLSGMTKEQVRQTANSNGITPLFPSESQDICFIHDNNFSAFIVNKQNHTPEPGKIKDLSGKTVGHHGGLHKYTIGQRRGLNCPASQPYYVKHIDIKNNVLTVCFKAQLNCKALAVNQINWNYPDPPPVDDMITKIRYSHKGAASRLTIDENALGNIIFDTPQNAVTPGQAAVFYKDRRVLGAGIIQ
ncbi:MAG: tRNA 2-thiouridine(34) synthase MnmA [Proteobacteria bacterium]|nr:tRNA 2-thiouridine(34) synthase MnmA [Pseudomonadota bacterium]MBU1389184.1 tRNA 2-thiouridine(34) synthase MnmA [Pseudomonadota bacterium]MBU1543408.1 tRNA 2-thiouridine(34) synthase MnmA [Pseudomonadota bacterium]MBU2482897.1 tRNA 2-thiouridine(34) synthase MnmA [Pseudomonadota bacterium]